MTYSAEGGASQTLPRRCECGGKIKYVRDFDRVFSWCEVCTPLVEIKDEASRPLGAAMKDERIDPVIRHRPEDDSYMTPPSSAAAEVERMRSVLSELRALSDAMAEDEGLWFIAETAAEAYLQQELRKLCSVIEGSVPLTWFEEAGEVSPSAWKILKQEGVEDALPETRSGDTSKALREALEMAAKVAEADYTPGYGPHRDDMESLAARQRRNIAERIRALSSVGRGGGGK